MFEANDILTCEKISQNAQCKFKKVKAKKLVNQINQKYVS